MGAPHTPQPITGRIVSQRSEMRERERKKVRKRERERERERILHGQPDVQQSEWNEESGGELTDIQKTPQTSI